MEKGQKTSNKLSGQNMKDWSTVGIKPYLMLMIEFLRISPSYELARKARLEGLSKEDKKILPKDFDQVLRTFDEFGDLTTIRFDDWWLTKGIYIYGTEHAKPKVRLIANVEIDEDIDPAFHRALDHHFKVARPEEGKSPALILSVPLGINKRTVLSQISKLIDESQVDIPVKAKKSARPLDAKRLRKNALLMSVNILWRKAKDPEMELWRLGVLSKVSPKNLDGLDAKTQKLTVKTADQRIKTAILTSRALKKAKQIAEQAARGRYPNSTPIELPDFEWGRIYERISKARIKKSS
jgi:hypothetical protein